MTPDAAGRKVPRHDHESRPLRLLRGAPSSAVPRMLSARPHRWLAALPTVLMLGGAPFANRVEPYVLGLPFLLAWIVGCVLLTSLVLTVVRAIDRRLDADGADTRGRRS